MKEVEKKVMTLFSQVVDVLLQKVESVSPLKFQTKKKEEAVILIATHDNFVMFLSPPFLSSDI